MKGGTKRFLLALMLLVATLPLAARQPPGIRWRQIRAGNVTVVFPPGSEISAAHLLAFASDMLPRLQAFWGVRLSGRLRILLTDSSDEANGSAGFYPFNLIEIRRVEPEPESEIGSSRNWLDLVLTHELSHLYTLHVAQRWLRALRSVFGANPALFPVATMPGWTLEGLAVYGESSCGEPGRLGSPDFPLLTAVAGSAGRIPLWSQLTGQPTFWPGPMARYLYGGMFFRMLQERYGHERIVANLRRQGSLITFVTSAWTYPRVFGVGLRQLWLEFRAAQAQAGVPVAPPRLLTRTGFYKDFPCETAPGRIVYARSDFRHYGSVEEVDAGSGRLRRLFQLGGVNGLSADMTTNRLYLSAVDRIAGWRDVSDLYEYDLQRQRLRRLSRGLRLSAPVADPAGGGLYCIQRRGETARLVRFDQKRRQVLPFSADYAALAHPAPAADGQRVAVALKSAGRNWAVAIFSAAGSLFKVIASPHGGKWYQPLWHNGDLYFIAEAAGRYRPARYRPVTGVVEELAGAELPVPRHFSFSRDGANLIISCFAPGGFEIALHPLAGAEWRPLEAMVENSLPGSEAVAAQPDKPYQPLTDLLPRVWSPTLRLSGRDVQLGAFTTGQDVPGTHVYSLNAYWGLNSGEPNFSLNYQFNGLYPVLELSVVRSASLERDVFAADYTLRERRLKLVANWPLTLRRRWQLWLRTDLHAERSREIVAGQAGAPLDLNGIRLGVSLRNAQVYTDSIGPADGLRLNLTVQRDWRWLGSSVDLTSAVVEYRHYVALPRPNLLAWRLAVADSWGGARRIYRLGGADSADVDHAADGDPFGLMRGYPSGWFSGRGGWLLNLEYRLALFKVERSLLPWTNINRFYMTFFSDIGNLWRERRVIAPAVSYGAELDVVLYFSGIRWVLAGGVAAAERPSGTARLFVRLGSSF